MPKTVQLRRYELHQDLVEDFLVWWSERLVPARVAHGFEIEFAYIDRETAEFTWAVSVVGDADRFGSVEAGYLASPEREAAFAGTPAWTVTSVVAIVDGVDPR